MAAKSNPVTLGTSNTTIYEAPATFAAFVQLFVSNVNASSRTYTLSLFKQSTGITTVLTPAVQLAGSAAPAKGLAVSLEPGDIILGLASAAASVVVTPVIDLGRSSAAKGFTPRGVYSAGATYALNDVVSVAATGASYISLQDGNIGNAPASSPSYWMLSADKGEQGDAGVAGASSLAVVRLVSAGAESYATDFENGDTIDGVVLVTNDLVLRASASAPERNGIYVVQASGAASRHTDFDTYDEHPGRVVAVQEGTVYADTLWQCTSNRGGTLNTTAIRFAPINGTGENRIINGAMEIDQRNVGAAVAVPADAEYVVDRFNHRTSGGGVYSVQQTAATAPPGFKNSLKLTVTTPDASIAAGDFYSIMHHVEGVDCADLGFGVATAKSVTLSFWVASSVTGTYGGALRNSAANRSYPFQYTIAAANTWERKTVTIEGDATGTWLTGEAAIGLTLILDLGSGSTYQGTVNAWAAANYWTAPSSTQWIATNAATFYLGGVKLEDGTLATPLKRVPRAVELLKCQRHCFRRSSIGTADYIGQMQAYSTTQTIGVLMHLPVQMMGTPIVTVSNIAHLSALTANAGAANAFSGGSFDKPTAWSIGSSTLSGSSGLVAGNTSLIRFNNASGWILAVAEL